VLLNSKPRRRQLAETSHAPSNVKSTIAFLALKVMVMSFVRPLVSGRLSRYFNDFNPALSHQCPNRAVDSRHTEALDSSRRRFEQLIDAQRALRTL
jgi:hypothetical protein